MFLSFVVLVPSDHVELFVTYLFTHDLRYEKYDTYDQFIGFKDLLN